MIESLQETALGQAFITFVVAMLPVIELRGAIPIGVSMGLNIWQALAASILGNMLPVPFIILFVRRVFEWLRVRSEWLERAVSSLESRAEGKWEKVHRFELLGLMILVAIPLPGTGAWTGALVAALMDIRIKSAIPTILLGVLIAGILVTGITYGFSAVCA